MNSRTIQIAILLTALTLALTACESGPSTLSYTGYLTEEIPPCTPIAGSSVDPCEPGARIETTVAGGIGSSPWVDNEPLTIRQYLDGSSISFIPHVVLRGTYIPDTVRCDSGVPNRVPTYVEPGWFQHSILIQCFADVRVNGYILGTGPSRLSVMVTFLHYWEGWFAADAANRGETEEELVDRISWAFGVALEEGPERAGDGIYGREVILFVGPGHNHATEMWEVFETWDVQREDDTVIAVHPHRDTWRAASSDDYHTYRSALEMTLPAFTQAVTAANQARVTEYGGRIAPDDIGGRAEGVVLPMLVDDANELRQFYTDTDAYNHLDGPPAQPPPPCGLAVPDQTDNPGLMRDCQTLLAAKDTLRGTGTLNWSVDTDIGSWDGVTVEGTPQRVTKLKLANKGLTGMIPEDLEKLDALTELRLSGNSLTGCIPEGLKDVTTNDLSSLNLLYCTPAPGAPTAGTVGETSVPLSWTAVPNTSKYRVEYREGTVGSWTVDDESIITTSHTVDELQCGTEYQFRLSAYGSGTTYAAAWSDPSEALAATTGTCASPVFDEASYAFDVAEDAEVNDDVGSVSATDPDEADTLTYAITAGNTGSVFDIDDETGDITVDAALDHETTDEYTLTVEAEDDNGNTDTVTVTITVSDEAEAPVFDEASYAFDVAEDSEVDDDVGSVSATDPDEGDT